MILLCGNMNEGAELVMAKVYPTVFVLFIPPRKQLEINVVRLKTSKNLPRKCRVSNHPVRKTYILRLLDAKVSENFGHRRLESLVSFEGASYEHQGECRLR